MCILFLLFPEHKARHKETRNRLEHTGLQMSCLCSFNDLMNNRRCSQVISMRGLVVPQAAIFTKLTSQLAQKPTFMQIPSLDISFFHVMWSLFPLEPFLMSSQQEESWQAEALLLHLHWFPERPPSAARCHLSSLALGFDSEDAVIPAFRRMKATADWSLWCLTEQIRDEPVWACSQTIVIKKKTDFPLEILAVFHPSVHPSFAPPSLVYLTLGPDGFGHFWPSHTLLSTNGCWIYCIFPPNPTKQICSDELSKKKQCLFQELSSFLHCKKNNLLFLFKKTHLELFS